MHPLSHSRMPMWATELCYGKLGAWREFTRSNIKSKLPGHLNIKGLPPTLFMTMSAEANSVGMKHNFLAAAATWVTCAGFVTVPNTFTSLKAYGEINGNIGSKLVQQAVRNLPLIYVAAFLCFFGIGVSLYLWVTHRHNYIWLVGHILL